MNEKRTASQVVIDILKGLNAKAAFVVEYRAKRLGEDDDGYDTCKEPVMVALPELQAYVNAKNLGPYRAKPHELGICSKFLNYKGEERHIVMVESDDTVIDDRYSAALKTTRGSHLYSSETGFNVAEVTAIALKKFGKELDLQWVAAGLSQGYHILRLTANAPRFHNMVPTEI